MFDWSAREAGQLGGQSNVLRVLVSSWPTLSPSLRDSVVPRVARERRIPEADLRTLVSEHTEGRQLGFLGEPRINLLELNLALDERGPQR